MPTITSFFSKASQPAAPASAPVIDVEAEAEAAEDRKTAAAVKKVAAARKTREDAAARKRKSRAKAAKKAAVTNIPVSAITSLDHERVKGYVARFPWLDTTSSRAKDDAPLGHACCRLCIAATMAFKLESLKEHDDSEGHKAAVAAQGQAPRQEVAAHLRRRSRLLQPDRRQGGVSAPAHGGAAPLLVPAVADVRRAHLQLPEEDGAR